jgi:hypothetical protein
MQSKKVAEAEPATYGPSPGVSLHLAPPTGMGACARRRAARRLEIDRDHRLVSRGLVREVSRLLVEEPGADPEVLIERMEAALIASRADHQRLNNARINLRGERSAQFADSESLPAALALFGHRGNYHGTHASMEALGLVLAPLVALPDGEAGRVTGAALAEALHLRCDIWTLECDGVVHVFARPDSPADRMLARSATRVARPFARVRQVELSVVE